MRHITLTSVWYVKLQCNTQCRTYISSHVQDLQWHDIIQYTMTIESFISYIKWNTMKKAKLITIYMITKNHSITKKPSILKKWKWKCVNFKCYSTEELITLNTLHEVVPTWYSFHSWVDWSNADKVSCSRRKHIDAGVRTVNLLYPRSTF